MPLLCTKDRAVSSTIFLIVGIFFFAVPFDSPLSYCPAHGHSAIAISGGSGPREAFHPGGAGLQHHAAHPFGPHPPVGAGTWRSPAGTRANAIIGLTPEGERVLKWAHLILDNWQSLQGELPQIKGKKGQLVGRMVLGVIPSALPKASLLTQAMHKQHPAVDFTILSHSSEDIIRALNDFSIEAGITYLDNEPVEGLLQAELYRENYCLFVSSDNELAAAQVRHLVRGGAAAALPAHPQHAEPPHHRPRLRRRQGPAHGAAGNQFDHEPDFLGAQHGPVLDHAGLFPQCPGRAGRRGGGAAGRTHRFPQGRPGGGGPRTPVAADRGPFRKWKRHGHSRLDHSIIMAAYGSHWRSRLALLSPLLSKLRHDRKNHILDFAGKATTRPKPFAPAMATSPMRCSKSSMTCSRSGPCAGSIAAGHRQGAEPQPRRGLWCGHLLPRLSPEAARASMSSRSAGPKPASPWVARELQAMVGKVPERPHGRHHG